MITDVQKFSPGSCSAKLALRRGNRHALDTNMFSALSRQSQLEKR